MLTPLSRPRAPGRDLVTPAATLTGSQSILLFGWMLYPILAPFYVLRNGMPQPADFLMAGLVLFAFGGGIVQVVRHDALIACMGLFLTFVAIVNLTWWSVYYNSVFLLSILYYAFNMSVLLLLAGMIGCVRERVLSLTQAGLVAAVTMQVSILLLFPSSKFRSIGTFNNPNQLGYYGLLAAACWLVVRSGRRFGALDVGFLLLAAYLIASSLSKAAMISFGIMLVIVAFCRGFRKQVLLGALGAASVALPLWLALPADVQDNLSGLSSQGLAEKVDRRFQSLGRHGDDSAEGRGYDRIWLYPEYLFFGAGEGASTRFNEGGDRMELHSTWGTLLFSYGVVGFLLFITMLVIIFRSAAWEHLMYFLPIVLYGLTHQGLRDSMLWVFLGLVFGLARCGHPGRRRAAPLPGDVIHPPPGGRRGRPEPHPGGTLGVGPRRPYRAFEVEA